MRKSGKAAILLFFSLITEPISDIFVLESISISSDESPLEAFPILRNGPPEVGGPRRAIRVYISLSLLVSGFLR